MYSESVPPQSSQHGAEGSSEGYGGPEDKCRLIIGSTDVAGEVL